MVWIAPSAISATAPVCNEKITPHTAIPSDDDIGDRQGYPYFGDNRQPYQVAPQDPYYNNRGFFTGGSNRGLFGGFFNRPPDRPAAQPYDVPDRQTDWQRPRRFDPDYFWNNRTN